MIYRMLFAVCILSLSGCGLMDALFPPDGACEYRTEINTSYSYFCTNETKSNCDGGSDDLVERFSKGESCSSLGYTYPNPFNPDILRYNEEGTMPSPKGRFASEGGGGNGGGGGNCSGYAGPEFDIQIDSQCKAAYAYQCSGQQQGVAAACSIYKQYQSNSSSIPNCPYCN